MSTTAITTAFESLAIAEQRLQLTRTEDPAFFPEWRSDLPELDADQQTALSQVRQRYLYQRSLGQLLEGAVTLLLASPMLTVAGFYDPPFQVKIEPTVYLDVSDQDETLQGRLDMLVLKEGLWVIVVESKQTMLSVWSALPQTLAYLRASPHPEQPSFAMMTNGDDLVFVKLNNQTPAQYSFSRNLSPFISAQDLQQAVQILKRIATVASSNTKRME